MAVRFRKYFGQCKPIQCNGKRSKLCPQDQPHKINGDYKSCGGWVISFRDLDHKWVETTYKDIQRKEEAQERLNFILSVKRKLLKNISFTPDENRKINLYKRKESDVKWLQTASKRFRQIQKLLRAYKS